MRGFFASWCYTLSMEPTETIAQQPNPYPVTVIIPRQEKYSRLLAFATILLTIPKLIILIPHWIILQILSVIAVVLGFVAQIAVLFTGRYPETIFNIVHGTIRWKTRVNSYHYGLTDKYPPFHLNQ